MKLFIEKFDTVNDLIDFSEDRFNSDIQDIVSDVINKNKRIVLLTGPSGSGKTTSAKKIVREIKRRGVEAVYLSMDNWFRTKSEFDIPLTEDGGFDYESPLCVNIELLNEHLTNLLKGEKIRLPFYDFVNQKMIFGDKYLQISSNAVIVLEGLHALNDFVKLDRNVVYRLLVCPQNIEYKDICITQKEIRLYRRITRDSLHRGRTIDETVDMFKTVSRGEVLYLEPCIKDIDYYLNSFLEYELFLHKSVLGDFQKLKDIEDKNVSVQDIPNASLMEEFYKK
jgi:uridine kinase